MIPEFYAPTPLLHLLAHTVCTGITVAPDTALDERMGILTAIQVSRIIGEIERINARLAELGDSDEDRVEELLLRAARRLLLQDLHELVGYEYEGRAAAKQELPAAGSPAVVEAHP